MGQKRRFDVDPGSVECGCAVSVGRGHAPAHAGPEVDEIRCVVNDNGRGRSGTIRIEVGCSGAKHDDLRRHRVTSPSSGLPYHR